MINKAVALACALGAAAPALSQAPALPPPAPASRPNIVVILADDLGYGDLGCYNAQSKVPTPNLDRLAQGGMRFTQAYCPDAVCTPSRYALMTGRYALRAWSKSGVLGNWEPPLIEPGRPTLPSILRDAGYHTFGIGKWHLGARYKTVDGRPAVGLGQFKADRNGANVDLAAPISGGPLDHGFDQWFGFICASETLLFRQNQPAAYHSALYDRMVAAGAEKLPTIEGAEYLPMIARETVDYIGKQAPLAKNGKPFFVYFAPYAPHIPLQVTSEFKGKTKAGDYGDYVHELDHYVGQVLSALDTHDLSKDTLVIFASDNGAQRRMAGQGHHPNFPLRGTKWTAYEGGVRTPLVVRWPGHVAAGATNDQLACLADIMKTCASAAGQKLPAGAAEDGFDLSPALFGRAPSEPIRDFVINRSSDGGLAIRVGDWKYLAPIGKGASEELYNLKMDVSETRNLAVDNPEIVARLKARLAHVVSPNPSAARLRRALAAPRPVVLP